MSISHRASDAAAVQQRVAAAAARRGAPGAQYLWLRGGEPVVACCHGWADTATAQPVTPQTTFNAYSITKPFTAAAALALAEAGRLDLERPIGEAAGIAGLEAYGSVRETLLHRAGFRNPNPLRWIHPAEAHTGFDEAAFVRAQLAGLRGSRRRLARSGYSNVGYLALGLAIERAWGGALVPAIEALVLDPLPPDPVARIGFSIDDPASHAPGHLRRHGLLDLLLGLMIERNAVVQGVDAHWVRLRLHQVNGSAYGGLVANAHGLACFGQAVLRPGTGMAANVQRQLLERVPGPGPHRSLGWFSGGEGRTRWFGHAGGGLGYYGELRVYPALDAVSVLLTNGPGLRDARCLDAIDAVGLAAAH